MYKYSLALILLTLLPFTAVAQSTLTTSDSSLTALAPVVTTTSSVQKSPTPALATQESGFLSYVDFGGSSNAGGHIFTLGLGAGYEFNERISVNARMPFYLVSAKPTGTGGTTQQTTLSSHGMGDPSFSIVLSFPNRTLDYKTRVTTSIPVASIGSGFSTGSVLVDWANRVRWRMSDRLIPFGQIDVANTVPDTPLFLLPYTARGFNTRFEGGTNIGLTKIFGAGGSFYYVLPFGQQHVYSRVCNSGSGSAGNWNADGWMTQHLTVGNDLTRDHGFSTWLTANLPHFVDLEIGFTRSYGYNLNTVSFGIGFDPIGALRHKHAE